VRLFIDSRRASCFHTLTDKSRGLLKSSRVLRQSIRVAGIVSTAEAAQTLGTAVNKIRNKLVRNTIIYFKTDGADFFSAVYFAI
jgi:hypothetical protein